MFKILNRNFNKMCPVQILTLSGSNPHPTKKFAAQLVTTAMEVAMGLPDEVKSSVTKNQGMDPGPVAKPMTKPITMAIETNDNQGAAS